MKHNTTSKLLIILLIVLLIGLYCATIGKYLSLPPTSGLSREILISTTKTGELKNKHSHITTLKISESELIIVGIDKHLVKLIWINELGEIIKENHVELDLYDVENISIDLVDNMLEIFYVKEGLTKTRIDLTQLTIDTIFMDKEVKRFQKLDHILLVETEVGLYLTSTSDLSEKQLLRKGRINSYDMTKENDNYHIVYSSPDGISLDVDYVVINEKSEIVTLEKLYENNGSDYLRYVKDVYVERDSLFTLHLWTDTRFGYNYITIQERNLDSLELKQDFRYELDIHKSRFTITDIDENSVNVLMQENIHGGVNLVYGMLSEDSIEVRSLSRTRKLSMLSWYGQLGDNEAIVFCDLDQDEKHIYFASANTELIRKSTQITNINPLRIITIAGLVIVQSVFFEVVPYVLIVALLPFLLLIGMNRFLKKYNAQKYIQAAITSILHAALLIGLSKHTIQKPNTYFLNPIIIGQEPVIYIILAVISIFAFWISYRYIKQNYKYDSTSINAYLQFAGIEFASYILLICVYTSTELVIYKI